MAFVEDTFTGSHTHIVDHTGETGASWTYHPDRVSGAGLTIDGRCNYGSGSTGLAIAYASGLPATAEYDVEWDVFVDASGSTSNGGWGRLSTLAQTGYFARHNGTQWDLFHASSGTFTSLGSFTQSLVTGNTYRVKLEIRAASKKVYIDGVERISSSNNAVTAAGRVGIRATTANQSIDNLLATDAGGGGAAVPTLALLGVGT